MVELSPLKIKDYTILTAPEHPVDAELGPEAREVRRQLALDPDCYFRHPSVVLTRLCVDIPIVLLVCLIEYLYFKRFDPAMQIMMKSEWHFFIKKLVFFLIVLSIACLLIANWFSEKIEKATTARKRILIAIKNSFSVMGFGKADQNRIADFLMKNNPYQEDKGLILKDYINRRTFSDLRSIPGINTEVIDQYENYLENECLKATGYRSEQEKLEEIRIENAKIKEAERIEQAKIKEQERIEQEKIAAAARAEREEKEAKEQRERESKINEVYQHFIEFQVPVTWEQSAIILDTFGTGGLIYSDLQALTRGEAHLSVEVARAAIASYNQTPMSGSTKAIGEKGEADVKYRLDWFLKEHPECVLISKDCASKYSDSCILLSAGPDDEPQEFDFLLLGAFGLVALEVKNYTADTVRVESDSTWILEGASGNKLIESPVDQVRRHEYVLRGILGDFPIQSLIVLANSNQAIAGSELSSVPVVSIRDLKEKLVMLDNRVSGHEVNVAQDIIEQYKCRN